MRFETAEKIVREIECGSHDHMVGRLMRKRKKTARMLIAFGPRVRILMRLRLDIAVLAPGTARVRVATF